MKDRCLGILVGLSMLLGGALAGCGVSKSRAVDSPLTTPNPADETPFTIEENVVLATELGWRHPLATPFPYQGVGVGEPQQIALTTQDGRSVTFLVPWGITGNLLIAYVSFTPFPHTAEDVPEFLEHAQSGLVTVDLTTGHVHTLREGGGGHSRFDGQYIVWEASQTVDNQYISKLHIYDLQNNREFIVEDRSPNRPDVSGGIVVWYEYRGGNWGVYGYNIAAQKTFTVLEGKKPLMFPRISGAWVVYLNLQEQHKATLHGHNIETGEDLVLGTTPYNNDAFDGKFHAVGPNWAAWVESETYQVHLYNLSTRQKRTLSALSADCRPYNLVLSGDILLLTCDQKMGYDLSRNVPFSVPLRPPGDWETSSLSGFVISGDRLVWSVTLDGEEQVYTAQILR